ERADQSAEGRSGAPLSVTVKTSPAGADRTPMAVAVREPTRRPLAARPELLERAGAAAWPFLATIVGLSFAVRTIAGWLRETPVYLGDEYLYAALGRSIAETGKPLVRGQSANFPALLLPLLTAPAW